MPLVQCNYPGCQQHGERPSNTDTFDCGRHTRVGQHRCKKCGKPTSNDGCLDCRYRNGGSLQEDEQPAYDTIDRMLRHSQTHFRDGFSSDQLQQVSPSER
jgi:predicted amidophosphoribosyltransferase